MTRGRCSTGALGGPATESLDPAAGVNQLLLTRIERMALRADLHVKLGLRGARIEVVSARAMDVREDVFGMDICLHRRFSLAGLNNTADERKERPRYVSRLTLTYKL